MAVATVTYAEVVKDVLLSTVGTFAVQDLESHPCFDDGRGYYLILTVGTDVEDNVPEDVYEVSIAVRVENNKVTIERNMTDFGLVDALLEKGVAYKDIAQ